MPELTADAMNLTALVCLALGAVLCFLGYRVFLFFLALAGFLGFGAAAAFGGLAISNDLAVAGISGLLGGFIGAVLLVLFYFAWVFCFGAAVFLVLALAAVHMLGTGLTWLAVLAIIVAGAAGGGLALLLQRFVIIVASSFKGAAFIVAGIFYFIRRARLAPALQDAYDAASRAIAEKGLQQAVVDGFSLPGDVRAALFAIFDPTSLYLMGLGLLAVALLGISVQYAVTAGKPPAKETPAPAAS